MKLFRSTYAELEPEMRSIVTAVREVPVAERPGTLHIDSLESIAQYAWYVALVREWLQDPQAEILDWGGQHGQVTRLLSRYYPRTTCYALSGDDYDKAYGLATWHERLGVKRVIRDSRADRINVDHQYDAVISSGVLEHVAEAGASEETMVSELRRVLRPGGLLFVWNLPRQWGRESLYWITKRARHHRRYRRKELARVFAGFELLSVATHEILPLAVTKRLGSRIRADRLIQLDYTVAERLPLLAQNFTVVARAR